MNLETYSLSKQILDNICNKKIIKASLLDVTEITTIAEVFIIAVASNIKQTQAMADQVEEKLKDMNIYSTRKEGYQSANWILLDYGDIIVHIFDEEHAKFYDLARLWQDAKCIESY